MAKHPGDPPPRIIQGGMGAGVSRWPLARAVSRKGGLGVVSGTALDTLIARLLQDGDPGGHIHQAARYFPLPEMAGRMIERWYIPGGKPEDKAYRNVPKWTPDPPRELVELTIFANFCEIWLAKFRNPGWVGINYLEKIQMPHLYSLYGSLLAGVDAVLMGAGIPDQIPGVLDALVRHQPVTYRLDVKGGEASMTFDPAALWEGKTPPLLSRPLFLPIVASHILAQRLSKLGVDGFVVEGPGAGGHNAPPRTPDPETGQKVYGEKDKIDWDKLNALNLPYWIADRKASAEGMEEARALGGYGIQVGSIFALCKESGLTSELKQQLRRNGYRCELEVRTNLKGSPTGFPFKEAILEGSLTDPDVYKNRRRVCNLGYLAAVLSLDGSIVIRCPAEPVKDYVRKDGDPKDTEGRECLCNSLLANVGLPQRYPGGRTEPPLITIGETVSSHEVENEGETHFLRQLSSEHGRSYTAGQAYDFLLSGSR